MANEDITKGKKAPAKDVGNSGVSTAQNDRKSQNKLDDIDDISEADEQLSPPNVQRGVTGYGMGKSAQSQGQQQDEDDEE